MKDEIITEVSKRVTKTVMDALTKKRESQYYPATQKPHASDSEYLLESDLEERVYLDEQLFSNISENRNKNESGTCSRLGARRFDSPYRRCRHAEKQRKKHSNKHGFQTPHPVEMPDPINHRRGQYAARNKRSVDEARTLTQNSRLSEPISTAKNAPDTEDVSDKVDTAYRQTTFTDQDSTDLFEAPILKLRLAKPYNGQSVQTTAIKEKVGMCCSVNSQDLFERPNDRVLEDCALADSDNVSIISEANYYLDMQQVNNSYEMILQRSSTLTNEVEENRIRRMTTEYQHAAQEVDDPDKTRDSSSFELLSEPPPSPPLSIHIDEDHFASGDNEASNYNINEETTIDKRGNQSKTDKCPYAIGAHAKVYQQNVMNGGEGCAEMTLEKHTGGAYSFVGESLPAPTKENKRSSPRKQSSTDNKSSENSRSERHQSNRTSSHDSYDSGNRNTNIRNDRFVPFGDLSTTLSSRMMDELAFAVDPMQILPEYMVTGAVHVATRAYTTARSVYDKILTTPMVIFVNLKKRKFQQSFKKFRKILTIERMRRWFHYYYVDRFKQ